MGRLSMIFALSLLAVNAAPALAQRTKPGRGDVRAQTTKDSMRDSTISREAVPANARPPRGMCRIWLSGVPAGQQPAATDCATAVKNRPTNGRVIFGDEFGDSAKAKPSSGLKLPPGIRGFSGLKTKKSS